MLQSFLGCLQREMHLCAPQATFQMAAKTVTVKPGCEVLLTRKIGKYPPGTRVTVVSVRNDSIGRGKSDLLVLQVSVNGRKEALRVMPARFEIIGCDSTVLACRMQLPIVSAYALTVHRSQGLTLRKVAINFSNIGSWIPTGMAYVALSKCSSMGWAVGSGTPENDTLLLTNMRKTKCMTFKN